MPYRSALGLLAIAGVAALVGTRIVQIEEAARVDDAVVEIDAMATRVRAWTRVAVSDVRYLADVAVASHLHETGANLDAIHQDLVGFMLDNQEYLQVRWLGNDGRERIRIDRTARGLVRASDDRLRDRSQQNYVRNALTLADGEVFLSPIAPNTEREQNGQSLEATFRLATPVNVPTFGREGIAVLNLDTRFFFEELSVGAVTRGSAQVFLIDPDGHALYHTSPGRVSIESAERLPGPLETAIRADRKPEGRLHDAEGIWLWRTIDLGGQRHWHLMTRLPTSLLHRSALWTWLGVAFASLVAAGIYMAFVVLRRQLQQSVQMQQALEISAQAARDRAATAEHLREAESRFRILTEVSPNGLVLVSADGRILHANESAYTLFGHPPGSLDGRPIETLVPDGLRQRHAQLRQGFMQAPGRRAMGSGLELRGHRADGTQVPIEVGLSSFDSDNQTVVLATITDISERLRNEAELAGKAQELEQTVGMLEVANEELSELAYAASHDLRAPIKTLRAQLARLQSRHQQVLPEEGRKLLAYAIDAGARLETTANAVLDFARVIERPSTLETLSLPDLVQEVIGDLSADISASDADVRIDDRASTVCAVRGRPAQLRLLLQNLIGNAIKYRAAERSPEVRIGWQQRNGRCEISVSDNGIGIDPADQEKIFSLFGRLHHQGRVAGVGLGLTLARKIARGHGGDLQVESIPGRGSTFRFCLAAVEPEVTRQA
ncbi:MAG: PAS domain S-box protein [Gammaproteobacteria bacterium]|nr:PAS domain S-box protein [Gammaproteobacteria bacterium]